MKLSDAIAELPDTADGIAAYFIEREVRGYCGDGENCPVANYLNGTGRFREADVNGISINAYLTDPAYSGTAFDEVATPGHVDEFIKRFDRGDWPELRLWGVTP